MKGIVVGLAPLAAFPAPVLAADCANATDQASLTACADKSLAQADAALNDAYKQVMARLKDDAAMRAKLVAAQRAWIAFRDADCAFEGGAASGGSAYPMIVASCKEQLTRQRSAAQQQLLHCEEGDMACPVPQP